MFAWEATTKKQIYNLEDVESLFDFLVDASLIKSIEIDCPQGFVNVDRHKLTIRIGLNEEYLSMCTPGASFATAKWGRIIDRIVGGVAKRRIDLLDDCETKETVEVTPRVYGRMPRMMNLQDPSMLHYLPVLLEKDGVEHSIYRTENTWAIDVFFDDELVDPYHRFDTFGYVHSGIAPLFMTEDW